MYQDINFVFCGELEKVRKNRFNRVVVFQTNQYVGVNEVRLLAHLLGRFSAKASHIRKIEGA